VTEKFRPLAAEFLADQGQCCRRGCVNCPYLPRHQGGIEIDEKWLAYALRNPEASYDDYLEANEETGGE